MAKIEIEIDYSPTIWMYVFRFFCNRDIKFHILGTKIIYKCKIGSKHKKHIYGNFKTLTVE